MALIPVLVLVVILFLIVRPVLANYRRLKREAYIREYVFPQGLFSRLQKHHPDLSLKDCQLIALALRQYFLAHLKSGLAFVSMPSQGVDSLWHEFILYTKDYERFCQRAFGQFMHHTPAVVLGSEAASDAGLRRCWTWVCREEKINPVKPTRLPLLFAIDQKLNIANGFKYVPDCGAIKRLTPAGDTGGGIVHCGGDLGASSSGAAGDAGDGTESNGHGDSGHGGDSSAGDGGGCGGGCGGGGGD